MNLQRPPPAPALRLLRGDKKCFGVQTGPASLPETPSSVAGTTTPQRRAPESAEDNHADHEAPDSPPPPPRCVLEAIYLYPVKSCAPQRVGAAPSPPPLPPPPPPPPVPHRGDCSPSAPSARDASGGGGDGEAEKAGRAGGAGGAGGESGRASWPLGPSGLAYDREWAIVDHRDRALRLKQARFFGWFLVDACFCVCVCVCVCVCSIMCVFS